MSAVVKSRIDAFVRPCLPAGFTSWTAQSVTKGGKSFYSLTKGFVRTLVRS